MLLSWSRFCELVKTEKRFLWYRESPSANQGGGELLSPGEVFDAIGRTIVREGDRMMCRRDDVRIVRGRLHDQSLVVRTAEDLGSPPLEVASNNRMSGAGISMFYGAQTVKTVIAELQPEARQVVTVGSLNRTGIHRGLVVWAICGVVGLV